MRTVVSRHHGIRLRATWNPWDHHSTIALRSLREGTLSYFYRETLVSRTTDINYSTFTFGIKKLQGLDMEPNNPPGNLQRYKAFRHVETLIVKGRNLYLAGLLLVGGKWINPVYVLPIAGLQGTDLYLERIKFVHVERPYFALTMYQFLKVTIHYATFCATVCSNRWREPIKCLLYGWGFLIGSRQKFLQAIEPFDL